MGSGRPFFCSLFSCARDPERESIKPYSFSHVDVTPMTSRIRGSRVMLGGGVDEKRRGRTHTTHIPLSNKKFGKAYARMISRQGPPWSAEIAADGRIFYKPRSDHKNGRNRAARHRPDSRLHAQQPPHPARTAHHASRAHLRVGERKCGAREV